MNDFDFRYFLHSVPEQIAKAYLKRICNWSFIETDGRTLQLFIRYYRGPTPDDYQAVRKEFPTCCYLESDISKHPRFILAAGLIEFSGILAYLSKRSYRQLLREIEEEMSPRANPEFRIGDHIWNRDRPRIMGILNLTPDSFFDGGNYYPLDDYGSVAEKMVQAGADMIDIGGESTRPGSESVTAEEEIQRLQPAVKQIRERFHIPISIDTVKPKVAETMLGLGADMINDVSGLSAGRSMIEVVSRHRASYCLMHTQGQPKTMQNDPEYFDPVAEIYQFLKSKLQSCLDSGLNKNRILLDPGIGFGKTVIHNLDILRFFSAYANLNCLLLIGTSNKSFIGHLLQREINQRLTGTLVTQSLGWLSGATVFRTHDVQEAVDSVRMARLYTHDS
ncbi:MAG: dihydropteroate synthase [Proteobacteria bacterium]|nr:dihydropteroate synthase [Pseudomonadota bacterium]